ncbi:MAG: carboxymuconolactone decarboxylase family protein [Clostridia bacterium]|nr:carboxymuconolactone decarboxylase family protein [Clostridia bacterium]
MQYNKRFYTIRQYFYFLDDMLFSIKDVRKAKKMNLISKDFQERIMIAVTEVNGCQVCSYYHAKVALESGVNSEEIDDLLSGEDRNVPRNQLNAVLFAKYYADAAGIVEKTVYEAVVKEYSQDMASGILGYIRMIMIGNVSGIAFGTLKNRITFKKVKGSRLGNELAILFGTVFFIPVIMIMRLIKPRKLFLKNNLV